MVNIGTAPGSKCPSCESDNTTVGYKYFKCNNCGYKEPK